MATVNKIKLALFAILIAGTASAAEAPNRREPQGPPASRPGYGRHDPAGYRTDDGKHYAPGYGPSYRYPPGYPDYNSPPTDDGGGRLNYGPLGGNGGN